MGSWDLGIGTITGSLGLAVSGLTFWLTLLRDGQLKLTQPTFIGFSNSPTEGGSRVFLRGMLYSTAKKGNMVENMFAKLTRNESHQTLNTWIHGVRSDVVRGSGLYVGQEGVLMDHHFALPKDNTPFDFVEGDYLVEVFATLVGKLVPVRLAHIPLKLTAEHVEAISSGRAAVFFNWGPDSKKYHPYIDTGQRRESFPVRTIDSCIWVELMPDNEAIVEIRDGRVDYYFNIRVLNAGPFPIKVKELFLNWIANTDQFQDNGKHTVQDEFKTLLPGVYQLHKVAIHGVPYVGGPTPKLARVATTGHVIAESDEWGGAQRSAVAGAFAYGVVSDMRAVKPA